MNRQYLPVKFIEEKYAKEMLKGKILMRPLADFGSWELSRQLADKDGIGSDGRRDVMEGTVYNLSQDENDPFFDSLGEEFKKCIRQRYYIDDALKEVRIYCMYRMAFDPEAKIFEAVEPKVQEFGDTAVIILNPEAFFQRLSSWCESRFPQQYMIGVGDVVYKSLQRDYGGWGLFAKELKYSWQKEVRIAAQLNPHIQKSGDEMPGEWITDMGDISDIAVAVPTEQLLNGSYKPEINKITYELLEASQAIPKGILLNEYVFYGDYRNITPKKEWISRYKQFLSEDEWIPITEMRQDAPDGKAYPILSFQHIDKKQRITFLHNRIGCRLSPENSDLYKLLLNDMVGEKHIVGRIALIRDVNLGETEKKYGDFLNKSASFQREFREGGMFYMETCLLDIVDYKSKNVFGMDVSDRGWHFRDEISLQMNEGVGMNTMEAVREFEKIEMIMTGRVDKLKEGDIYEGFNHI